MRLQKTHKVTFYKYFQPFSHIHWNPQHFVDNGGARESTNVKFRHCFTNKMLMLKKKTYVHSLPTNISLTKATINAAKMY